MSLDIEAGIGIGVADAVCGAGRDTAMASAIEVAIAVPLSDGRTRRGEIVVFEKDLMTPKQRKEKEISTCEASLSSKMAARVGFHI